MPPVPLQVRRAPEADDVLWENVTIRGTGWLARVLGPRGWKLGVKGRALRTHLVVAAVLVPMAWLIYQLTIAKLAIVHNHVGELRHAHPRLRNLLWGLNALGFTGDELEGARLLLYSLLATRYSLLATRYSLLATCYLLLTPYY